MAGPAHNLETKIALRRGEAGSALLNAIMVLAACSAVISLQMRGLENDALEDHLSARSMKAQHFAMTSIGLTHDLIARKYLDVECKNGRAKMVISKDAPETVKNNLARAFNPSTQSMRYQYCDYDRFTTKQLDQLYTQGGSEPRDCARATSDVRFVLGPKSCDSTRVFVSVGTKIPSSGITGKAGGLALTQKAWIERPSAPKPAGCPFQCHLSNEKPVHWVRTAKGAS